LATNGDNIPFARELAQAMNANRFGLVFLKELFKAVPPEAERRHPHNMKATPYSPKEFQE
jgi:hypothetical protein